jgi:hypothetical protein
MPLRDHFHPSLLDTVPWEQLLSTWVDAQARQLNDGCLPPGYRAHQQVRLNSPPDAVDQSLLPKDDSAGPRACGAEVQVTATPGPQLTRTFAGGMWPGDVFEVQVHETRGGGRLAATVQLVGPGNKDRTEHRDTFVRECAGLLHQRVGLVIVDIVTRPSGDLDSELLQLLGLSRGAGTSAPRLYAVAYRPRKARDHIQPQRVCHDLAVGRPLPTLPLWLAAELAVPLELEAPYQDACRVLRID